MSRRCVLIHTVASLVPVFAELTRELLPGVDCYNVVDESLLKDAIRDGCLTPSTMRRTAMQIMVAEMGGADAILVTCSSIGPVVDSTRALVSVPLVRVDEPMAEEAVSIGRRIAVLATLSTTLDPTTELIERTARAAGRSAELLPLLVEGAFAALTGGDQERHDGLIRAALERANRTADVIVLAQASMARVASSTLGSSPTVPVLSSPRLGVRRIAEILSRSDEAELSSCCR
jgi:Asp/Glu/hydantoin racemase